ncbi:MAG: cell division protein ZipA [Gammaproteobacteria bacterium]|nr:cell division protein ZipA [Gammaproteobacteria bacterium]
MNWSLGLNIFLLLSVVAVLTRMLKKKEPVILSLDEKKPILNQASTDEIISVRKVTLEDEGGSAPPPQTVMPHSSDSVEKTLMLFLLAKPKRQLAGYEMLQTILSVGLRFGEEQLFHYHQNHNGQGPILCSLAAATPTGKFDLPNIGAFNAKGLCLFMYLSNSPALDTERLEKMIDTAQQLAEGLDTYLLDDQRKPFTNETKTRYRHRLESMT